MKRANRILEKALANLPYPPRIRAAVGHEQRCNAYGEKAYYVVELDKSLVTGSYGTIAGAMISVCQQFAPELDQDTLTDIERRELCKISI